MFLGKLEEACSDLNVHDDEHKHYGFLSKLKICGLGLAFTCVHRIWKFNSGPVRFLRWPPTVIIINSLKCMYSAFLEPFLPCRVQKAWGAPHTGAAAGETRPCRTRGAPFAPVSPRVAWTGSHSWSSARLSFFLHVDICLQRDSGPSQSVFLVPAALSTSSKAFLRQPLSRSRTFGCAYRASFLFQPGRPLHALDMYLST